MTYAAEVLADNPVLFWKLNEGSGTSITDYSGNAFHGTATASGITYGVDGPFDNDTALEFDGTDGYVSRASNTAYAFGGAFTLEAWVYSTDEAISRTWHTILCKLSNFTAPGGSGGYRLSLWSRVNSFEAVYRWHSTTYGGGTGSGDGLEEGMVLPMRWYHLAVTCDGDTTRPTTDFAGGFIVQMKHYVDGVLCRTLDQIQPTANADTLYVGRSAQASDDPARRFQGRLAGVALYATALSEARIAAHFAAGEKPVRHGASFPAGTARRVVTAAGASKVFLAGIESPAYTDAGAWWNDAAGFDDSAWDDAVAMTQNQHLTFPFRGETPAGAEWVAYSNGAGLGASRVELHRIHFTLARIPAAATLQYATDNNAWVVLNGTELSPYSGTFTHYQQGAAASRNIDPSLFVVGDNVLAVYVRNGLHNAIGGTGSGPTGLAVALLFPPMQRCRVLVFG